MAKKLVTVELNEQDTVEFCGTKKNLASYKSTLRKGLAKLNPDKKIMVELTNDQTEAGHKFILDGFSSYEEELQFQEEFLTDYVMVCDEMTRYMDWVK